MNMIRTSRTIGGVAVHPGALITLQLSQDRVFGRLINPGARCESLEPEEAWTAVVCADSTVIWEGGKHSTYDDADAAARTHARERIDNHLRSIFA